MGKLELKATKTGAKETKKALSGVNVKTSKVFVGTADYEELMAEDAVNITIGVFIDGTLNNRTNTKARQAYDKAGGQPLAHETDAQRYKTLKAQEDPEAGNLDSYVNDQSNVARLEPAYPEVTSGKTLQTKIYIEGMGTTNLDVDDYDGTVFGTGPIGIPGKVQKAIVTAVEEIGTLLEKNRVEKIQTITFDVFGFSRGAAAARHFVSKLYGGVYTSNGRRRTTISRFGDFGKLLYNNSIAQPKFVQVRFAGLYETVASYGKTHVTDTWQLHLKAISRAKHVFQLVAEDEHRENFVITDIASAGPKGVEKFIPGVHSDIGGGYTDNFEEKDLIIKLGSRGARGKKKAQQVRKDLIKNSWYKPEEIYLSKNHAVYGDNALVINKVVASKKYSYVCLHLMLKYANTKKLEMKSIKIEKDYPLAESVSVAFNGLTYNTNLSQIENRLWQYVIGKAPKMDFKHPEDQKMMRAIRLNYIHSSAHYSKKVYIEDVIPYYPLKPRRGYETRQRETNPG